MGLHDAKVSHRNYGTNPTLGANQGLGFAIAQVFSQSSKAYTILVGSRNLARGQEAVTRLLGKKANPKSTIETVEIDVSSTESIAAALDKISKDHGHLDILVNNAGVGLAPNFNSAKRDDWRFIFEVNVFGVMDLTQSAFPLLQKSADPKVVLVTSNMGSITRAAGGIIPVGAAGSPYAASKAAINMMLANWQHTQMDVRFWAICPGLCATEFYGDHTKQHGRDPVEAADIVRQCVEGQREDGVGKVSWEEGGKTGIYDW